MNSQRTWFTSKNINKEHLDLPIRQVYLWFVTSDLKIVIIGKGEKWQFPGGKPEDGETQLQTLKREVWEESGIILSDYSEKPRFFGYYLIENDINPKWTSGKPYLQVRYFLKTKKSSKEIKLSANEREDDLDTLEEAKFVDFNNLEEHIWWVKGCEEDEFVKGAI